MKAIVYQNYGPSDVLHVEEVEKPISGDNDVLIRVRAVEAHRRVEAEQRLGLVVISMDRE